MALKENRELVFKSVGGSERWKLARKALKAEGLRGVEAAAYEREMPTCGCGAKLDQEFLGPYGRIDRRTYYISVREADAQRARNILLEKVGAPLVSDELVLPAPRVVTGWRKDVEDFLDRCFG